jgi:hypothetical protein
MKKKVQPIKSDVAPFCQTSRANRSKNVSSLTHHASNNKNKIVAHQTGHGNAQFGPTQQPTNNPAALI